MSVEITRNNVTGLQIQELADRELRVANQWHELHIGILQFLPQRLDPVLIALRAVALHA